MGAYRAAVVLILGCAAARAFPAESPIPRFGRDTVLVWTVKTQEDASTFVVRIAEFLPVRYIEWENATTQGTIKMSSNAVARARVFVNARLFEGGVDTKGKDATTLWLSQWAFRELKAKSKLKMAIDSVDGWMMLDGAGTMSVEINRTPTEVPVIRVKDDRGQERWFLDVEENPLMARHIFRAFSQTLKSVTTDRPNTLRWIKGRKLSSP
jgi:hypothetical protein